MRLNKLKVFNREQEAEEDFCGPVKVMDGLFLGDHYTAKDHDFLAANRVTYIINFSISNIPNHWQGQGIHYLSYDFKDSRKQVRIYKLK